MYLILLHVSGINVQKYLNHGHTVMFLYNEQVSIEDQDLSLPIYRLCFSSLLFHSSSYTLNVPLTGSQILITKKSTIKSYDLCQYDICTYDIYKFENSKCCFFN